MVLEVMFEYASTRARKNVQRASAERRSTENTIVSGPKALRTTLDVRCWGDDW